MSLYRRGNTWWYTFRFAGQRICESAKTHSKTVARDAERARRRELEEGYNGVSRREQARLFNLAADTWLETRTPHVASKTIELYKLAIRHLKREFGGTLLSDIAADDVARYQAKRTGDGASGRTVNMETGVLRQILRKYKLWGKISDDVRPLKERRDIGRALTPEEEAALLAAAADRRYQDSPFYVIVVLALNTAMRSQEIKTLRWRQVDLVNRCLTVGRSKTDAGTGRVIPLNQSAAAVLEYWHSRSANVAPDDCVFPACENHHVDPSRPVTSFRTAWRNATKKAGLAGLRFHDLRHTAITKLAETIASDQTIMAIAGHVSRKMLEHYSHVRLEAKRRALEAIERPAFQPDYLQFSLQSENPEKAARRN
ncbi:MAG TPA: tyrosine-type recombinase/integrase [Terriglobia bacterium]|nr:tyrosine-type recombinase/integrase [Terriglobia bacterium]